MQKGLMFKYVNKSLNSTVRKPPTQLKVGKSLNQALQQREHMDGHYAHEKMWNITDQ